MRSSYPLNMGDSPLRPAVMVTDRAFIAARAALRRLLEAVCAANAIVENRHESAEVEMELVEAISNVYDEFEAKLVHLADAWEPLCASAWTSAASLPAVLTEGIGAPPENFPRVAGDLRRRVHLLSSEMNAEGVALLCDALKED